MIGVLTASTTSGSVLGYDLGDLKNKEQRIQILGSEGVFMDDRQVDRLNQNWTDAASLKEFKFISRAVADDLAKQFDSQAAASDRIVRATGHIALSFSPEDRPRLQDNDFKVQLATEYMEQMGIVDTQWVITEHYDTHAPHLHIAYNRVKFDGSVIDSKNERYRSQKIAAEISQKYGLTPAGETPRLEQSLTPEQQLYSQMRTLAREALKESCTMEEFKNNLRQRGIEVMESEHSEQQKSYGLSYALIEHPEISAKGSKLDRSALSYAKVSGTLGKNLAARTAIEQANAQKAAEEAKTEERAKAKVLHEAYGKMVPPIQQLSKTVGKAFDLYSATKQAGVVVSAQTNEKYSELKNSWKEFRELNKERKSVKTAKGLSKAIGGMLMLLNPVAGLLVVAVGSIAANIRISSINAEKKALLGRIEEIRSDIDALKTQKAHINIEKKERLDEYLQAKDTRNEFRQGMESIKSEIQQLRQQTVKREPTMQELAAALGAMEAKTPKVETPKVSYPSLDGKILGSIGRVNIHEVRQALMLNGIKLEPIHRKDGAVESFKILHEGHRYTPEQVLKPETIPILFKYWEKHTGQRSATSIDREAAEKQQRQRGHGGINADFRENLGNKVEGPDEGTKHGKGLSIGGHRR